MHTRLCRLFRVRGRWRPVIGVLVYYMLAVVLVENVIIAWHTSFRLRSSVARITEEISNVDYVDTSRRTNRSSRPSSTEIDVERILRTTTLDTNSSSLPMTTTAAVAKPEAKAERYVLSPMSDMTDLERRFYRLQSSEVNHFRHGFRRAPPGLCHDETRLVVLIHSHPKYLERRTAIRNTWGSAIRSGHWPGADSGAPNVTSSIDRNSKFMRTCCDRMQMAFVVGLSRDTGLNDAVDEEYLTHWDVVQGDFIDDYQNMTLKSLTDLKFVNERCRKVKYLLKTDDDMIINLPYLVEMLDEIAHNTSRFIVGPLNVGSRVYRNGKWRLSKDEFPFEFFPPYESGSAYVISSDLVGDLLEASRYVPSIFIDDVYITGILGRILGVHHVRRNGFAFWTSRPPQVCDLIARRVVTGTKMTPTNLNAIWQELQRRPYCPADLRSLAISLQKAEMAAGCDVRDILELEADENNDFITKEALFNDSKKKKTVKKFESNVKKPEGMHRELWGLLWTDNRDAPPMIPTDTNHGYKQMKAKIGQSRVRPWKWMPFTNPARKDGAVFYHWRRAADEGQDYPFARFNKTVDVPVYSDLEYQLHLHDENWTKQETDQLFELCRRFDLRFVVIHDRWDCVQSKRSIEDLKERYYSISNILTKVRSPGNAETKVRAFDAQHERRRKEQLEKLYQRTEEQIEEEEKLMQELKKIEQRKKEREKKTLDLQKLITAADSNADPRRPERKTTKKMIICKVKDTSFTPESTNIKFPDIKQSGVHLRSQRMKLPGSLGQKKTKAIEQILEELGVDPNPMPTREIASTFNDLRQDIVLLYELKLALANCEYELQTLRHRHGEVVPGQVFDQSSGSGIILQALDTSMDQSDISALSP